MSVFDEVKERVTALDAFRHYGIAVGSKGMCCCIFHNDKHPSMKVDRRYHCFGCGADGDAIDFVSNYYGLSAIDAAKKLNEDFCLGIQFGVDIKSLVKTPEQMRQKKNLEFSREVVRAFDILRRDAINTLSKYHRLLWDWKKKYEPKDMRGADWHPFFVEALNRLDLVNELLDDLCFGERSKQIEVLEIYGEEIKRIEERIKNFE
ncbi:MAG: DNA primase [Butyrivibrio sp.]|nr:DNA primase [Butyrivibrio sp.]